MAGYSGTPLPKKLGLKENQRIALIHAPANFQKTLGEIPQNADFVKRLTSPLDLVILFVEQENQLRKQFSGIAAKLAPNGMIWVAWPKKTSGVATNLSFNSVQTIGLDCGLVDVKICAIDDTWSGLKFVIRVKDRKK